MTMTRYSVTFISHFSFLADTNKHNLPSQDPNKLCPFCDDLLPDNPSEQLRGELKRLEAFSTLDPRHNNSQGLYAPIQMVIPFCQQHIYERTLLPEAIANQWPLTINFDDLPHRLQAKETMLRQLAIEPSHSSFYSELLERISEMGSAKALGILGQLESMSEGQAG
jgi:hypothetical protein